MYRDQRQNRVVNSKFGWSAASSKWSSVEIDSMTVIITLKSTFVLDNFRYLCQDNRENLYLG